MLQLSHTFRGFDLWWSGDGKMRTQWGITVPMRDGIKLIADLFLPGELAYPLILVRTPYGRQKNCLIDQARYFMRHGYAVLNVDVRGRGDSEGEFIPYRNEGLDGFDTIVWAGCQSWCNESVGTLGGSYLAKVQWLCALEKPPHLKAMIPLVSPSDPFVEWPTGAPVPSHLCWLFLTSGRTVQSTYAVDWNDVYTHLPIASMDEAAGRPMEIWKEECKHLYLDEWWQEVCYQTSFDEIDIPVMHISGWYDDEQVGTLLNFVGMKNLAPSEQTRAAQRLVMGPWPHNVNESTRLGDIDFGPKSVVNLREMQLGFFNRWLKGELNGFDEQAPVSIFVMGENKWREEETWPLERTEYTPWYLRMNHVLSETAPEDDERQSVYIYNPKDPVTFITEPTSEQIGGPDDYQYIHQRDDVLVYTSEVLVQPLEVSGPVKVVLYAESSAPDTDFMAQLHDVWPTGYTQRLCDGMIRVRFRNGMDKPELLTPNTPVKLEIHCWNTSHVFLPGHSICIHITSSAFPKYDRNLNTGENLAFGTVSQSAKQIVYHDAMHPSAVVLPVIPRRD